MADNTPPESGAGGKVAMGPAAVAAGLAGSVALEKLVEAASKVIDMIRDKEMRERVTNTFNAIRADALLAGYVALKDFNDFQKYLKPEQRDKIQEILDEADQKLQEALDELSKGVSSANAGNEGAAKEHFENAEKAGHEAIDLFRKADKKKHQFLKDNLQVQHG